MRQQLCFSVSILLVGLLASTSAWCEPGNRALFENTATVQSASKAELQAFISHTRPTIGHEHYTLVGSPILCFDRAARESLVGIAQSAIREAASSHDKFLEILFADGRSFFEAGKCVVLQDYSVSFHPATITRDEQLRTEFSITGFFDGNSRDGSHYPVPGPFFTHTLLAGPIIDK